MRGRGRGEGTRPRALRQVRRRAYRALTQRIGVSFELVPLALEDTRGYLEHRLAVAGGGRALFTDEAVARLHEASGGIPRVLNQLATQALLEGMARGVAQVDETIVAGVAAERDLSAPVGARG